MEELTLRAQVTDMAYVGIISCQVLRWSSGTGAASGGIEK
jgi:hypothetical protein